MLLSTSFVSQALSCHALAEGPCHILHKCVSSSDYDGELDDWAWDLCDESCGESSAASSLTSGIDIIRENSTSMSQVSRPLLSAAVRGTSAATCTGSHVQAVEAADQSRSVGSETSGDASSSESSRDLVGTGQALQAAGHPPSAEEAAEAVHQLYDVLHGYALIAHFIFPILPRLIVVFGPYMSLNPFILFVRFPHYCCWLFFKFPSPSRLHVVHIVSKLGGRRHLHLLNPLIRGTIFMA